MSVKDRTSEEKLICQLRQGNEVAFREIYTTYWQPLFNQAYKRMPKQEVVKELIQDLFTELWQKKDTLAIHTSLSAYLHHALRFKIFNHIKSEMIREKHACTVRHTVAGHHSMVEEQVFFQELALALQREIADLPAQPKHVYLLKHEQGMSYIEIANTLKISVSTVEKHMIKALKTLRHNLKEYALTITFVIAQL